MAKENSELLERLAALEKENAKLRAADREQRKTIKGINQLVSNGNIMLKELKKHEVILQKDRFTFNQLFLLKCRDRHILKYLGSFFGSVPNWDDITDDSIGRFQSWLTGQKKRIGEGLLSESTIALYMTLLKGVIKFGYSARTNTGAGVKIIKAAKEKKAWLRPSDLRKILEYDCAGDAEQLYAKKMCLISAITGARISDCEQLSMSNVDGNTLRYIPIKTKTFEAFVSLTDEAKICLNELFDLQTERIANINPVIREICMACGIDREMNVGTPNRPKTIKLYEGIHVHTFRHSFATIKYRYGNMTERQISNAIGHANIAMTLDNYVLDKSPVSESEMNENKDNIFN